MNDSIRALTVRRELIENFGEKETQMSLRKPPRIEDSPAYVQLVQKRADLSSKLENLKLTFKEKHPDVIKAKNDIDKVNDEIEALKKITQKRVKTQLQRVRGKPICKSKISK